MASEYEMSVNDYIAILKHRAVLVVVSIAVIFAVSVLVAMYIPLSISHPARFWSSLSRFPPIWWRRITIPLPTSASKSFASA